MNTIEQTIADPEAIADHLLQRLDRVETQARMLYHHLRATSDLGWVGWEQTVERMADDIAATRRAFDTVLGEVFASKGGAR